MNAESSASAVNSGTRSFKQEASIEPCYFPIEGFGETYRRVMMNRYFQNLLARTRVQTVAEYPVDTYGVAGAGNLVFSAHGCDVTFISDQSRDLEQAAHLYEVRGLPSAHFLKTDLERTPLAADAIDLSWSFDRVQVLPDPVAGLREMARVSKMVMVVFPNARNYGQYLHWMYHKVTGTTCDYVGPRHWMRYEPVREALVGAGLNVLEEGLIDVPWWPGFPELPCLVRQVLRRPQPTVSGEPTDPFPDNASVERKVMRSAFIEKSKLPRPVRRAFAHNLYILAMKPAYQSSLMIHK